MLKKLIHLLIFAGALGSLFAGAASAATCPALVTQGFSLAKAAAPTAQECTTYAACNNALIIGAFKAALNRAPTATECVASRFAGGNFNAVATMVPLVKASLVCQDPWIAQAYVWLGSTMAGHDPTTIFNGAGGSTLGYCNYSLYGSWPDFPTLVSHAQSVIKTGSYSAAPILPVPAGTGRMGAAE